MVVMAPSCDAKLMHTVTTAAAIDDRPSCFMYPRGNGIGAVLPPNDKGTPSEIGKGRILKEGNRVAILGYGTIVQRCVAASELLEVLGIPMTMADARFCEPLDGDLIHEPAKEHEVLITVEEGSIQFPCLSFLGTVNGLLDGHLKWRAVMLPDRYNGHGSQTGRVVEARLGSRHIAATVLSFYRQIQGEPSPLQRIT